VLLVWAIVGCFIFSVLEYYDSKNIIFTYGRILFTILQGTWFYQVGFMLYPPSDAYPQWDMNDHSAVMLIAVYYCWHIILIFVGLGLQLYVIKFFQRMPFRRFNCEELIYIDNLNHSNSAAVDEARVREYSPTEHGGKTLSNSSETRFLTVNSDDEDDDETGHDEHVIFNKN
jgi:hypothetical protein